MVRNFEDILGFNRHVAALEGFYLIRKYIKMIFNFPIGSESKVGF